MPTSSITARSRCRSRCATRGTSAARSTWPRCAPAWPRSAAATTSPRSARPPGGTASRPARSARSVSSGANGSSGSSSLPTASCITWCGTSSGARSRWGSGVRSRRGSGACSRRGTARSRGRRRPPTGSCSCASSIHARLPTAARVWRAAAGEARADEPCSRRRRPVDPDAGGRARVPGRRARRGAGLLADQEDGLPVVFTEVLIPRLRRLGLQSECVEPPGRAIGRLDSPPAGAPGGPGRGGYNTGMRTFLRLRGDQVEEVKREVVREQPLTVYVNGERFLTLLCSPMQLEALVVGYLWMEQVITALGEIVGLEISEVDGWVAVTLTPPVVLPTERVLTSGCGGGITFRIDHRLFPKRASSLRVPAGVLAERMKDLFSAAVHYQRSRGIYGASLSDGERLLIVAEDVGRHNAVDKVKGEALLQGIPTEDLILLSTGRISSEMLLKAARMGVPLVASRTSPTEMAVGLAEQLNVTVCGYVRGDSLNLYAGSALLLGEEAMATRR